MGENAAYRLPPVTLDAAWLEQFHGLATAAMNRNPEVAERLMAEIERATIVASAEVPPSVVTIGSEVTFRDEATRATQRVTVVMPLEADIARRRVSILTPIGAALIGLDEGACIDWETLSGEVRRLTVLKVERPATEEASLAPEETAS